MNGSGPNGARTEPGQDRPPRNAERGGRSERGNRGERSRGERTDSAEPGSASERGESRPDARGERRPERNRRPDDSVRAELPSRDVAGIDTQAPATEAQSNLELGPDAVEQTPRPEGAEPREKRSRDRYGRDRDRGPRGERTESRERQERPARDDQPVVQEAIAQEPRRSYFATGTDTAAPTAVAAPAPQIAEIPAAAPVPQAPVSVTPVPTPVVIPAAVASSGMPKLQPFALPLAELAQVAQSSGLNWVNSDSEKIAAVQAAIAAEPKPIHVPRERPATVQVDTGPLVLVETKRDLRHMTLPFEEQAPQ